MLTKKSDRIYIRVSEEDKINLNKAANIESVKLSPFIRDSALLKAKRVIKNAEQSE